MWFKKDDKAYAEKLIDAMWNVRNCDLRKSSTANSELNDIVWKRVRDAQAWCRSPMRDVEVFCWRVKSYYKSTVLYCKISCRSVHKNLGDFIGYFYLTMVDIKISFIKFHLWVKKCLGSFITTIFLWIRN